MNKRVRMRQDEERIAKLHKAAKADIDFIELELEVRKFRTKYGSDPQQMSTAVSQASQLPRPIIGDRKAGGDFGYALRWLACVVLGSCALLYVLKTGSIGLAWAGFNVFFAGYWGHRYLEDQTKPELLGVLFGLCELVDLYAELPFTSFDFADAISINIFFVRGGITFYLSVLGFIPMRGAVVPQTREPNNDFPPPHKRYDEPINLEPLRVPVFHDPIWRHAYATLFGGMHPVVVVVMLTSMMTLLIAALGNLL